MIIIFKIKVILNEYLFIKWFSLSFDNYLD